MCSWRILRILTGHHKKGCIRWSMNHLLCCEAKCDVFLLCIAAGDESWCHHFEIGTKPHAVETSQITETHRNASHRFPLLRLCWSHVWTIKDLLTGFKGADRNIIAMSCNDTLDKLNKPFMNKWQDMPLCIVILLHDNAHPSVTKIVQGHYHGKFEICHTQTTTPISHHATFICLEPLKNPEGIIPLWCKYHSHGDQDIKEAAKVVFHGQYLPCLIVCSSLPAVTPDDPGCMVT